ncbi:MAG: nucleoside phosphorylase [Provencibacterium sp.]|jgi:uridine phosphorylase|nr:nucleoside phosphorylase [Provencibacterium sp.]
MKDFPVYRLSYKGTELCMIQAAVASGSAAMMADWLYGRGVGAILCCGALDDIPQGDVILPVCALRRDHYLLPFRFVELPSAPIAAICHTLQRYGVSYVQCATWSTDGFYRETPEMVAYRREEGCRVVEMECAALAAVAQFRKKLLNSCSTAVISSQRAAAMTTGNGGIIALPERSCFI